MPMNFIKSFYDHVRNTLVWFVIYFILQAIIWALLGVLIMLYPQALFTLVIIFFFLLSAVSIYFAVLIARYVLKLKKIKELISFEK